MGKRLKRKYCHRHQTTIALRVDDSMSFDDGNIEIDPLPKYMSRHIAEEGYVWIAKNGRHPSSDIIAEIMNHEQPTILLVYPGPQEYYWAWVADIKGEIPHLDLFKDKRTYYKFTRIEKADYSPNNDYTIKSTGKPLYEALRKSMSPFFIVKGPAPAMDDRFLLKSSLHCSQA